MLTVALGVLNGGTRTEVDLAKMQVAPVPPGMLAQLRAAGLDHMTTLASARDGHSLMVYPDMRACAEISGAGAAGATGSECAVEKRCPAAEGVGGWNCESRSVTINCGVVPAVALTGWFDKSRKDLPVKMAMTQDDVNLTMKFQGSKEDQSDAKLFAGPKELKKFASLQELKIANLRRLRRAAPAK